jgi:hypothetical protein
MRESKLIGRLFFNRYLSKNVLKQFKEYTEQLAKQHKEQQHVREKTLSNAHRFERPEPIALENREQQQTIREMIRKKEDALLKHQEETEQDKRDSESGTNEGLNTQTGEVNGPRAKEPTRYGDWAFKGRTSDF